MKISTGFDSGNIQCLSCTDPSNVRLSIRKDNNSDFYQWFHFRASGVQGEACQYVIENAADAAYPKGWDGYQAVASYDREFWFRVPTAYKDGELVITHTSSQDGIYYAYFAPYPIERHADLIATAQTSPLARLEVLGETLDGQDIDLLVVGDSGAGRLPVWTIARQHPGETMAEWWMEGFLERLLDEDDAVSKALLKQACFYAVPNMNPDGSRRGHLRTNAAGANLNREWQNANMETSPEVYLVRQRMHQTGVGLSLDVHGDEALPYNFIAGTQGIEGWTPERDAELNAFRQGYQAINPDFQTTYGYPANPPGTANLSMCSNYIAHTFGCLAMTLEMPFKDTADTPDVAQGWSPERAKRLGMSFIDVLWQHLQNK
ncbi:M14 family metallopeptidase [Halioxenophilus aromaticivorans]|uniref:M14-type cytosolic carboxypeptidase n=1 Tax=Halioxenophilus aromaticivorans TaxID=1306992 RepID=A0AAV3U4P8_9ALTE